MRKPMMWISTRPDTNQAVQPQKMARGCKFLIWKAEEFYCTVPAAKTKGADQLCSYCSYADCWLSGVTAHISSLCFCKTLVSVI